MISHLRTVLTGERGLRNCVPRWQVWRGPALWQKWPPVKKHMPCLEYFLFVMSSSKNRKELEDSFWGQFALLSTLKYQLLVKFSYMFISLSFRVHSKALPRYLCRRKKQSWRDLCIKAKLVSLIKIKTNHVCFPGILILGWHSHSFYLEPSKTWYLSPLIFFNFLFPSFKFLKRCNPRPVPLPVH